MKNNKNNNLFNGIINHSKIILIISIIILGRFTLLSQEKIEIKDTVLYRNGSTYILPVYSNISLQSVQNLKLKIKFNHLLVDITGIQAGSEYGIKETNSFFSINTENFIESYLEITASDFNSDYSGILFGIQLETLAGPDSIAIISPIEITINDEINTAISLLQGKIMIGLPVYPIINEGIQEIFPNPFAYKGTVQFSIKDDTYVKFFIYSSNGRLIGSIPGETAFKYDFYDKKNNHIPEIKNYNFTRGYYKFTFEVINWKFSSGLYTLVMETNRGVYEAKLLLLK